MQKGFQLKKLHLLNRKSKEKSMNLCFCNVFDMIQSDKVDDAYWGHSKFIGLKETMFTLPTGPNFKALSGCKTIGKIFDVVWSLAFQLTFWRKQGKEKVWIGMWMTSICFLLHSWLWD